MTANTQDLPLETPLPRKRNPRGSLNREVILAEAFTVCRNEGLGELSMPKVAKRMGVGVTSLYWYFHTKEELLLAMLAQVSDEFLQALPDHDGLPWDEHFRRYFSDMRRIFLENDMACDFLVMRADVSVTAPGTYFMSRLNREVGILMDAGLSPEAATRGYQAMSVYTTGTVQKIRQLSLRGESANEKMFRINDPDVMRVIGVQYPNLAITGRFWHRTYSADVDYEFGLNSIIDGLRTLIP